MKSWKSKLKNEIRKITERMEMRSDVKAEPLCGDERLREEVEERKRPSRKGFYGVFGGLVVTALVAVLTVVSIVNYFPTNPSGGDKFFACVVEINPSVAFLTDEDLKVVEVKPLNGDADILLSRDSTRSGLIGESLQSALRKYSALAAECGYIDVASKDNAVRVSNYGMDTEAFGSVKESLAKSLASDGIYSAVVGRELDSASVADVLGLKSSDLADAKALKDSFCGLPSTFAERQIESFDTSRLEEKYGDDILGAIIYPILRNDLTENVSNIIDGASALLEISSLNLKITLHLENPVLFGGYWDVLERGYESDGDFGRLMSQMQDALKDYETRFGVALTGDIFSDLKEKCDNLREKYDSISNALVEIGKGDFRAVSEILDALEIVGYDVSVWRVVAKLPTTVEEYAEKAKIAATQSLIDRIDSYSEIYSIPRQSVSDDLYEDYIDGLIKKYGSLEGYWESRSKKN